MKKIEKEPGRQTAIEPKERDQKAQRAKKEREKRTRERERAKDPGRDLSAPQQVRAPGMC